MKREVERTVHTARWVAEIVLPTGKVLTVTSDWKPPHWDEHKDARMRVIREAKKRAEEIRRDYGVTATVVNVRGESRRIASVTETSITARFDSAHYLTEED